MTCRKEKKIPNSSSHPSYGVLEKACGGRISRLLQLGMYSVAQNKSTVRLQDRYVVRSCQRLTRLFCLLIKNLRGIRVETFYWGIPNDRAIAN